MKHVIISDSQLSNEASESASPKRTRLPRRILSAGLASLLVPILATGCMGYEGVDSAESSLNEASPIALDILGDEDEWMGAPAGCEDRLDVDHSFVVASAPDSLVAALDDTGEIVCVDSLESVQVELEGEGREDEARELAQRFHVTLIGLPDTNDIWDDPSPQPSTEMDTENPDVGHGVDGADPSPQPS